MLDRPLGTTDVRVSALGLGCNNFGVRTDLPAARNIVAAALDAGITFFDTADVYGLRGGSETILGEVLGAAAQRYLSGQQVRRRHGRRRQAQRRLGALCRERDRGEPEAAEDRLDRSLLLPPARSGDADRGDAARARRADRAGQGALHRLFEYDGGATRGVATHRARERPAPFYRAPRINTTCCRGRSKPTSSRRCRRSNWR